MEVASLRSLDDLLKQYGGYRCHAYISLSGYSSYTIIPNMFEYFGDGKTYRVEPLPYDIDWYKFYHDYQHYFVVHGDWFETIEGENWDDVRNLLEEEL